MGYLVFKDHFSFFHFFNGYDFVGVLKATNSNFSKGTPPDDVEKFVIIEGILISLESLDDCLLFAYFLIGYFGLELPVCP